MIDKVDCDVGSLFLTEKRDLDAQSNGTTAPSTPTARIPETIVIKKKADKAETEQFYLSVRRSSIEVLFVRGFLSELELVVAYRNFKITR